MGMDCLERDGYLFVASRCRLDSRQVLSMARRLGQSGSRSEICGFTGLGKVFSDLTDARFSYTSFAWCRALSLPEPTLPMTNSSMV